MVHRDLKPENILVVAPDDDFEVESVRVVDFGLAKLLLTRALQRRCGGGNALLHVAGAVLGEPLDVRSDVYSLGAMFYEMLSGKRPFDERRCRALSTGTSRTTAVCRACGSRAGSRSESCTPLRKIRMTGHRLQRS